MVHSQLLWLAHAESRRYTVNINDPSVQPSMLQEHRNTLKVSQRNPNQNNISFSKFVLLFV